MGSASSFLCIGYGFNDQHLQPWLVERCYAKSIPLVLITRGISEKAHAFFKSGKCQRYMALEQAGDATKLFSNEFPDGVDLPDSCYWELNEFLTLVM
jgi:hypothetical protein